MKKRPWVLITIAFLLFFPLAGTYGIWLYSHRSIQRLGGEFASEVTPKILGGWDWQTLYDLGTLSIKQGASEEEFREWQEQYGTFVEVGEFTPESSKVIDRADMKWHLTDLVADVKFEEETARLEFTAGRRAMSQDEWRIERFVLRSR